MKGFDVLHVKSAVKSRNRIPLSNTHITTMDFGQIVPLKFIETIPGGEYPVEGRFFCRTAPLVKPTYGKFAFKLVNAFVPYHQIAFDCDAWITGKTTFEGTTPLHRFITYRGLVDFIITYCSTTTGATPTNSQFRYTNASGQTVDVIFTNVGRYYIKVLTCLGYSLPQGVDLRISSSWSANVGSEHISAYPLLGFLKLYNDYMSQSQRFNTSALSGALQSIKYNKTLSGYNTATGEISASVVHSMISQVHLNYENDYFTSAWQNPNSPLNAPESVSQITVPGTLDVVNSTTGDNSIGIGALGVLNQRALDFLRSFDDWVRRNNFSGSRSVQQIYSRFGIKTDDYRTHYAEVFSTETMPVQVGDVTATADTTSAPLGDYAGKAIMDGSKGFTAKVSDYGIILVLGYMTVTPMNPYGFDRTVLRSHPLDYYTPEFDGLGADAISVGEFYCNPLGSGTVLDTDVFGFTERYNSYRFGRDQITGDFRDYHSGGDMNTWHTGRDLEAVRAAGNLVAQSSSVNTMLPYDSEYNRIFAVTSGDVDHFYMTCQFKVDAILPMLNLNQTARLGEGDTALPRNGNVIS